MTPSQFFFRFLPLWLVFFFLKGLFSEVFYFWFFDLFTALALAFLLLLEFNLWAFLAMGLLGLSRAFDGSYPLLFFVLYYSSLLWLRNWGKKYLREQSSFFPYLFWSLAILVLIFFELLFFFNRLNVYSLTYTFWFHLLLKTLFYAFMIFLLTLFSHWLLRRIWDHETYRPSKF